MFPRFVSDWLKKWGATGYIRWGDNPDIRRQDGYKAPLLCQDCEQRFAAWEKNFAEQVFHPLIDAMHPRIRYGDWMLKFAVSVAWRAGLFMGDMGSLKDSHLGPVASDAQEAMETWRRFLLGEIADPGRFELHIIPVSLLESVEGGDPPRNLNVYLTRSAQLDVVALSEGEDETSGAYIYCKVAHILLFGFLRMDATIWKGTEIDVSSGFVGGGENTYEIPQVIMRHIFECARNAKEIFGRKMSDRQQDRITETWQADLDRATQSKTAEAVRHDLEMFGRRPPLDWPEFPSR